MLKVTQPQPTPGNTEWFRHDRFGLFIHWGLYALPARHEWIKNMETIPDEVYEKYFKRFDPDLYDPSLWAQAASGAGMKYFVVTTKHHEGFCLWDTDQTDYKSTNTPYGKDLLTPMVEAFREKNMKVGFYHSLLDWHHPEYTLDECHPFKNKAEEYAEKFKGRDLNKYVDYLHAQSRELLTRFGKVDILWYDFSVGKSERYPGKGKDEWRSEELLKIIRELQPEIIINDRLQIDQDVKTPEQYQPRKWVEVDGKPVVWEACQTFSGSWGYHRDEQTWKSVEMLVQMLIDTVSKGGNLLLNVGPTGRGEFDERALDRLSGIGKWMKNHDRSIYGCTQSPEEFTAPRDCRLTYNPELNRLYIHMFSYPFGGFFMDGKEICERIEYAQFLNDASEVRYSINDNAVSFNIPVVKPNVTVPVIEVFLK
ncbi:MAG: alpha-L-fucosidase [Oscillospiraceae bacterium]|nr:alpha-L-fucosidase [Oscillospiraceae bacterium]